MILNIVLIMEELNEITNLKIISFTKITRCKFSSIPDDIKDFANLAKNKLMLKYDKEYINVSYSEFECDSIITINDEKIDKKIILASMRFYDDNHNVRYYFWDKKWFMTRKTIYSKNYVEKRFSTSDSKSSDEIDNNTNIIINLLKKIEFFID